MLEVAKVIYKRYVEVNESVFRKKPLKWCDRIPKTWVDSGTLKCLHFHRKDDEDGQLTAAQIYLKLGEVGAESGRFSRTDAVNQVTVVSLI